MRVERKDLPESTRIEENVTISARPGSLELGEKNTFYPGVIVRIDKGWMKTGREVSFGPGCLIYEPRAGLEIGDYCLLAGGVKICGVEHGFDDISIQIRYQPSKSEKIVLEEDVYLGMGVIVLPGVVIGKGSVIGAGSVVTKDIPPMSVAYGNPCRVVRVRGD